MKRFLLTWALLLLIGSNFALAQVPMTGAGLGKPTSGGGGTCAGYSGPGDAFSGWTFFGGLRAFSLAQCNAGTALINVCLPAGTPCQDMYPGSNGVVVITTITSIACNNTTPCTVSTIYDTSGANDCSGSPCNIVAWSGNGPFNLVLNCINTTLPCLGNVTSAATALHTATTGPGPSTAPSTWMAVGGTTTATYSSAVYWNYCFTGGGGIYNNSTGNTLSFYSGSSVVTETATNGSFYSYGYGQASSSSGEISVRNSGTTNQTSASPGTATACGGQIGIGAGAAVPLFYIVELGNNSNAFSAANFTTLYNNQHTVWGF